MNIQVDPTNSNLASAMLNSKIRPRAVVGYCVKIFHPSPPNYVIRSPGDSYWTGLVDKWLLTGWLIAELLKLTGGLAQCDRPTDRANKRTSGENWHICTILSSKSRTPSLFLQASSSHVCNSRFSDFHLPGDFSTCQIEVELYEKANWIK